MDQVIITDPSQVTEDSFHLLVKKNFDEWIVYLSTSKFKPSIVQGTGCRKMVKLLDCLDRVEKLILNDFHDEFTEETFPSGVPALEISATIDHVELVCDRFSPLWFEVKCSSMKIEMTNDRFELHNYFLF